MIMSVEMNTEHRNLLILLKVADLFQGIMPLLVVVLKWIGFAQQKRQVDVNCCWTEKMLLLLVDASCKTDKKQNFDEVIWLGCQPHHGKRMDRINKKGSMVVSGRKTGRIIQLHTDNSKGFIGQLYYFAYTKQAN